MAHSFQRPLSSGDDQQCPRIHLFWFRLCRVRIIGGGAIGEAVSPDERDIGSEFGLSRVRGIVAAPSGEDGVALTPWDSTQAPHVVRRAVAAALALPQDAVRVVTPAVGGAFGPKGRIYPEEIALAAVALSLDRPVSWQATRSEDLRSTYQGRGIIIDAALAARADCTILGLRATLTQDCGAYLPNGIVVPESSAQHLIGPYRVPAMSAEIVAVYTHKVPLTPLRGGGREGGVFAMERLLDHLARELQLDPLEVRRRNALRPDEFPHDTGYPNPHGPGTIVYDSGDYPTYLEKARALIGYDDVKRAQPEERAAGLYRGVAVTLFLEATGLAKESARVEVTDDGGVHVTVGSPSNGQSHATTFAQVCAARLGVPVDKVTVTSGDTAAMGEGTGTFASRMAVMGGNAVALAARSIACPSASSSCRTSTDDVAQRLVQRGGGGGENGRRFRAQRGAVEGRGVAACFAHHEAASRVIPRPPAQLDGGVQAAGRDGGERAADRAGHAQAHYMPPQQLHVAPRDVFFVSVRDRAVEHGVVQLGEAARAQWLAVERRALPLFGIEQLVVQRVIERAITHVAVFGQANTHAPGR